MTMMKKKRTPTRLFLSLLFLLLQQVLLWADYTTPLLVQAAWMSPAPGKRELRRTTAPGCSRSGPFLKALSDSSSSLEQEDSLDLENRQEDALCSEAVQSNSSLLWRNGSSRRDWMVGLTSAAAAAIGLGGFPLMGHAFSLKNTASVCDPTVSVWTRGNRIIYLLGTAHISKVSAELAGQLVRDILPDAVFVELDLKRVGGVGRYRGGMGGTLSGRMPSGEDTGTKLVVPVPVSATAAATTAATAATTSAAMTTATAAAESMDQQQQQPRGLQNRALGFGAAQVGNAIRGMYKSLDKQGFKPGEEFILAVKEGQRVGADIVLGDQDVEVTLRRLVLALQQTDLKKLVSPDSELEQSMKELLPGGGAGETPEMVFGDKKELEYFVEAVKTRDRVRKIMGQLKEVAPALVQVMLTERDAYMATGLNTLDRYETIVAVMGIAHIDGVEKNLKSFGWKQVRPRCPRR